MVKIRLRRMGAKKAPFYRIVVADSRYPRDGRFIEEIGTYNPVVHPAELKVDADRDHLIADVRLQQGQADLPHSLLDVGLGETALAPQLFECGGELFRKSFKRHGYSF